MFKNILLQLDVTQTKDPAVDFAVSMASMFSGHVTGLAFAYLPTAPGLTLGDLPSSLYEQTREENDALAKRAIGRFESAAIGASVPSSSSTVTAQFSDALAITANVARRFDVSVIGQSRPEADSRQGVLIESLLFGSGRPLVVIPYIQNTPLKLEHVTVCWDNSQHAARAIADALPLLLRAKKIEVVTVNGKGQQSGDLPGADIGKHLARHGLSVSLETLVAPDIDTGDAILSHAADTSTDFVVMGGYGHSRLREFVLGGVTRKILGSMTVPVLMSH